MSKDKQQKNKSNTGTASAVLQFHDRPLAYKLSVAVALLLVICMSLMILISAVIAGRSLNKTVSGEFNGIATENALNSTECDRYCFQHSNHDPELHA